MSNNIQEAYQSWTRPGLSCISEFWQKPWRAMKRLSHSGKISALQNCPFHLVQHCIHSANGGRLRSFLNGAFCERSLEQPTTVVSPKILSGTFCLIHCQLRNQCLWHYPFLRGMVETALEASNAHARFAINHDRIKENSSDFESKSETDVPSSSHHKKQLKEGRKFAIP